MEKVTVIGAGLAGSECAWQLAQRGIPVELVEMKPKKMTPAHVSPYFAELVCSSSLRSDELTNAVGLLKEELRRLGWSSPPQHEAFEMVLSPAYEAFEMSRERKGRDTGGAGGAF